jgi:HAMP domain-containing protein
LRRRLLLAFLGLTTLILVGAVAPLGLQASAHDYSAYVEDTQAQARTAAAAAEELLADHLHDSELGQDLAAVRRAAGSAAILSPRGTVIRKAGAAFPVPRSLIERALRTGSPLTEVSHDRVLVIMPVSGDGRDLGVVALLRPTERLEYGLRTFWLSLVAIAAGALALAVILALGLSRWVGRPLAVLDASARRLGDGDPSVRLPDASCPPEFRHLTDTFNTMAARLETLGTVIAPSSRTCRISSAPRWPPCGCGWTCSRPTRRRMRRTTRAHWARSPGCPGWSTGSSPWPGRRMPHPSRRLCGPTR